MRKILCILSCLLVAGCTSFDRNPYDGALRELRVTAVYPEGYAGYLREGVAVKLSDRNTGNVYTALTDAQGHAGFRVAAGHYRLSVLDLPDDSAVFNGTIEQVDLVGYLREGVAVKLSDRNTGNVYTALTDAQGHAGFRVAAGHYRLSVLDLPDDSAVFNGTIEQVDLVGEDKEVDVALKFSKPGTILIKEIYSGGCMQDPPATGTYADDKYIILHNNGFETYYLDGLCLAMVAPYNSQAANPWTSTDPSGNIVFRDYAAVPDCIWMFPGSGTDFPLQPGEDAVVAYHGVDHTQTYSQSVNLNRKGCFVLYDMVYYPGNKLHPTPVPGDQIDQAHYMKVLKKTGTNTAVVYVISQNSPAVILFRAPEGFDLDAYLADDLQSTVQSGSITYSKIPWDDWIVDGVEVCNMTEATKHKRLHTDVDAGYVGFSAKAQGHTLHRKLDEAATAAAGFERYVDTNNSSNDFYERETQSLRD